MSEIDAEVLESESCKHVLGVSFSPDGQSLVAGGNRGWDVWDLPNEHRRTIPNYAVRRLFDCRCDPCGRWLYVSDDKKGLRLLSLNGDSDGECPGSPYNRHVISFDLTGDGRQMFMSRGGGGSNRIEVWNIGEDGDFTPAWSLMDGEQIDPATDYLINQSITFTSELRLRPDATVIATAENREEGSSEDRPQIGLRDTASGEVVADWSHSEASFDLNLVWGSNDVLFIWDDQMIERWDANAGSMTHRIGAPGRSRYIGLVVDPSGSRTIAVTGNGKVCSYDAADLSLIEQSDLGIGKLQSLAVSSQGQFAAGNVNGKVALWT